MQSTKQQLKALAEARRGVIVPGAFNALSAKVIEDLGYEALYVTGAGVTNMGFGLPDQGFMGLTDIADHTARMGADELGRLGYGFVLYANAALQGAVAGMQKVLAQLRDAREVREDHTLVAPFAERQRLVGKPFWDALEKKYA